MGRGLCVVLMLALAAAAPVGGSDAQLVGLVKAAIARDKLAARPDCLDFVVTHGADPGVDQVEVMEHHDAACGGDPQVQHRLFEVLVDQKTHRMASDAGDPVDGTMRVVP